ncbi:MAG: hypothetical protein HYT19_01205 [Candidatus Nealsonbacteria bacterium]|nr:hypothetical protein [Candidatus Nealsonbacteria bacterium]
MLKFYKNKIKKRALLLIFGVYSLFLNTSAVKATEINWPTLPGGLTIDNKTTLPELITYFFNFSIAISGILAFAMLIYGGVRYVSSVGNPAIQKDARDIISSAILGLLLLLASVLLLQIINPDILTLKNLNF